PQPVDALLHALSLTLPVELRLARSQQRPGLVEIHAQEQLLEEGRRRLALGAVLAGRPLQTVQQPLEVGIDLRPRLAVFLRMRGTALSLLALHDLRVSLDLRVRSLRRQHLADAQQEALELIERALQLVLPWSHDAPQITQGQPDLLPVGIRRREHPLDLGA